MTAIDTERANLETTSHKDQHDRVLQIRPGQGCSEDPQGHVELTVDGAHFHVNNRYARRIAERICESARLGAVMFEAADHPGYEDLSDLTLEEKAQLPARFHIPVWQDTSTPQSWICRVCWDEGTVSGWPCSAAASNGGEVFTSTGEFYDRP